MYSFGYQVPGESYRSWLRSLLYLCDVIRAPVTSLEYVHYYFYLFLQKNHCRSDFYSFRLMNLRCRLHGVHCISEERHTPSCATHIAFPVRSTATSYEYYSTQTSIQSLTVTEHTRQGVGRRQTSRKRPLFGRVRSGGVRVIGLCQVK